MGEEELKPGQRIETIERPEGKQTLPVGTKGTVKFVHPEHKGLTWITTDTPTRAMVPVGKKGKERKEVVATDFFVTAEEIKKI